MKSYLIVKEKKWWKHKTFLLIQEWNHSWRKTHLGGIIGSTEYRDQYLNDLVKDWDNQLTILSTIAETQLQIAYLAFATGFISKLKCFLRTTPNIRHLLLPLERIIWNKFISAVTGCHSCNDKERVLISLPTWYDGLAIPIFHKTAEIEFMNSNKITSELTAYDIIEDNLKKLKTEIKKVNRRKIQKRYRKWITKKNVLWIYQLQVEFHTGWQYFQLQNLDSNYLSSHSGVQ